MKSVGIALAGIVFSGTAFAQAEVEIKLCNATRMSDLTVRKVEREAGLVLQTAGIDVVWLDCTSETMERPLGPREFVVVIGGYRPSAHGIVLKDTLGSTRIADGNVAASATVYREAVINFARSHFAETQTEQILGYAIAHEIGHLLLGPGHTPKGVMRAAWGSDELKQMTRRAMTFTPEERARVLTDFASRGEGRVMAGLERSR